MPNWKKLIVSGSSASLSNLNVSNAIQFDNFGSGNNTGTTAYNLAVDSSGNVIENSANTRSVFVATSTDTSTNINATTTINWNSEDIKDSGYTHSDSTNPNQITITVAGTYKIYAGITYTGAVQRANIGLQILVNGVATGARGAGGYVRNNDDHNTSSTTVEDYVTVSANDVITIQTDREANSGTINLISGESKLIIEKLTGLTLSLTNANTLGGLGAADFLQNNGSATLSNLTVSGSTNITGSLTVTGSVELINVSASTVSASNMQIEDAIRHTGDSDTFISMSNDLISFTVGGRKYVDYFEGYNGVGTDDRLIINSGSVTDLDYYLYGNNDNKPLIRTLASNNRVYIYYDDENGNSSNQIDRRDGSYYKPVNIRGNTLIDENKLFIKDTLFDGNQGYNIFLQRIGDGSISHNNVLGGIVFAGDDSDAPASGSVGFAIQALGQGNWVSGSYPSKLVFYSGEKGDENWHEQGIFRIDKDGKTHIGTDTAPQEMLWVSGAIQSYEEGSFISASNAFAANASFTNSVTASSFTGSFTGSFLGTASNATTASHVTTASFALRASSASIADTATTASHVVTASFADNATSASYAVSASHEIIKEVSSSFADTASLAQSGDGNFTGSFTGSYSGSGNLIYEDITVTVVDDGGNKYAFNGVVAPTLSLNRGELYRFDLSDSSNSGHPFAFRLLDDTSYTTGVTTVGTAGNAGAYVEFDVDFATSSSLKYYCTVHGNGMGNRAQIIDVLGGIISGSFSGSFQGDGSNLTGVASPTGSYTGSFTGSILGDVIGTASIADLATTASFANRSTSASIADSLSQLATSSFADRTTSASIADSLSQLTTASFADRTTSASIADELSQLATASHALTSVTSSFPLGGVINGSVAGNTITLARGDGSTFDLVTTGEQSVESASIANVATVVRNGGSGSFSGSFQGDGSNITGITVAQSTLDSASFTSQTSYTASHALNSTELTVAVYGSNNEQIIPANVRILNSANVGLDFATSTTGKVVLTKGGHIVSGSIPVVQTATVTASFTGITSTTASHNFGTKNVIVTAYTDNDEQVIPSVVRTLDDDKVGVDFASSTTGRIVIAKGGHLVSGSREITTNFYVVTASTFEDTFTSATNHTASHNFGTKNVFVQVYDNSDNIIVPSNIRANTVNEVGIDFASTRTGRVVVGKSGHLISGSANTLSASFAQTASVLNPTGKRQSVSVHTSDFTGSFYTLHIISSSLSMSAPTSPEIGDWFKVSQRVPSGSNFASSLLFGNGSQIMSASTELELDVEDQGIEFIYADATQGWVIIGN